MANVFFGKVQTNGEYVDIEEIIGSSLSSGTSYLVQFQGVVTVIVAPSKPAEGGFVLFNSQIFQYTPNGTDKMWVKTHGAVACLNIRD